jgi:hypothetical protein
MYHICPSQSQTQIGISEAADHERNEPVRERRTLQFAPPVRGRLRRLDDHRRGPLRTQALLDRVEAEDQLPRPQCQAKLGQHPLRQPGLGHRGKAFVGAERGLCRAGEQPLRGSLADMLPVRTHPQSTPGQPGLDVDDNAPLRISGEPQEPRFGQDIARYEAASCPPMGPSVRTATGIVGRRVPVIGGKECVGADA